MRAKCSKCGKSSIRLVRNTGFCKVCWQHGRVSKEIAPPERPQQLCILCYERDVAPGRTYGHCERCFEVQGGRNGFDRLFVARGYGPCACGCGKSVKRLFAAGHHMKFLPAEEQRRRSLHNDGDTQRRKSTNPKTYVKLFGRHEHRFVAEEKIGRALKPGEIAHHKNEDKKDNRKKNIGVLPSQADHASIHSKKFWAEHRANKK